MLFFSFQQNFESINLPGDPIDENTYFLNRSCEINRFIELWSQSIDSRIKQINFKVLSHSQTIIDLFEENNVGALIVLFLDIFRFFY